MDKGLLSTLYSFFDLPLIADIASLIGLTLTIFVLFGIRIIQRNFLFRARVPDFLGKIQEHASSISTGLNTYPDSKDAIDEVLSLAEVDIDDLCRKSRNPLKKKIKSLRRDIRKFRKSTSYQSKSNLRNIYLNMNRAILHIRNLSEDEKWGIGNDH